MVNDSQMRVRIILIWLHNLGSCASNRRLLTHGGLWELRILGHTIETSALLFSSTLLEEDLAKDILFLVEGVIVLHIVVMGLVEHRVGVVIAVGVLVAYASDLAQLHMRVGVLVRVLPLQSRWHIWVVPRLAWAGLLREVLAR